MVFGIRPSLIEMEDAVRPNEQSFKAMYERGYRTWFSLYETTITESETQLTWWGSLFQLQHPSFPEDLAVDASFSNTVLAKGRSTWTASRGTCDLPSFDQDFLIPVASDRPTILEISDQHQSASTLLSPSFEDDNHIAVLILAWTYVLSARWAEIIPGTSGPEYNEFEAEWDIESFPSEEA